MNLKIQIFNSDIYKIWNINKFGINLLNQSTQINYTNSHECDDVQNMQNVIDFKTKCIKHDIKVLSKYQEVLKFGEHHCMTCGGTIDYTKTNSDYPLISLCYHEGCDHLSHLSCMSNNFKKYQQDHEDLNDDRQAMQKIIQRTKISEISEVPEGSIIPKKAPCPSCSNILIWTTLVRYSTLTRLIIGYDGKIPTMEEQAEEEENEEEGEEENEELDEVA